MDDMTPDEAHDLYTDIRSRIEKRFAMRAEFFGHFAAWLVANLIAWTVFFVFLSDSDIHWALLIGPPSGGWTIGLIVHAVNWMFAEWRETAIERALDQAGLPHYLRREAEKRKHDERLVGLSDDGELVKVDYGSQGRLKQK